MNDNIDLGYNKKENGSMKELLNFLSYGAPIVYKFFSVSCSIPVTVLTNVLDENMKPAYSSGITISKEKRMCAITIKNGITTRLLLADRKFYSINDTMKTYTCEDLDTEELKKIAAQLQKAFTLSNYDLNRVKTYTGQETLLGVTYDAQTIDDDKLACTVYAQKDGRIKYIETGGILSEVIRYDNKSIPSMLTVPKDYIKD